MTVFFHHNCSKQALRLADGRLNKKNLNCLYQVGIKNAESSFVNYIYISFMIYVPYNIS